MVALATAAALMLASCTDYKARLRAPDDPVGGGPAVGVEPPRPVEGKRSVWQGERTSGWVHLRFDVSREGETGGIEVIRSSDPELEARAVGKLADWAFAPATRGGAAEAYSGLEMVMVFYTDDTTTTAEAIGIAALVIVLIPVVVGLALLGAFASGDIRFKSN